MLQTYAMMHIAITDKDMDKRMEEEPKHLWLWCSCDVVDCACMYVCQIWRCLVILSTHTNYISTYRRSMYSWICVPPNIIFASTEITHLHCNLQLVDTIHFGDIHLQGKYIFSHQITPTVFLTPFHSSLQHKTDKLPLLEKCIKTNSANLHRVIYPPLNCSVPHLAKKSLWNYIVWADLY